MKKIWKCTCCDCIIVINEQDDATKYKCPQCSYVKCNEGIFYEISYHDFMDEII